MDGDGSQARARVRITRAAFRTPGLAALILAAVLAAAEGAARTDIVRDWLGAPGVGSTHRQFEVELAKLDRLVRREGPIDHLFIGSSVVYRGVDPVTVSSAYRDRTGRDLRGFSFGISAMTAPTTGVMAEILVERYHPGVLVYGVSPIDLLDLSELLARAAIEETPWVRYRMGQWSVAGWMTEFSSAYRQYLPYRTWRGPGYARSIERTRMLEDAISPHGFRAVPRPRRSARPGEVAVAIALRRRTAYEVSPAARAGLARIARLHRAGVVVILVEVPLKREVIAALPNGEQDYRSFVGAIDAYAVAEGIPFWRTRGLELVPDDGWTDERHMNPTGARRFSRWLGERLADAASVARKSTTQ